jgi:hypothetical protein
VLFGSKVLHQVYYDILATEYFLKVNVYTHESEVCTDINNQICYD